MSQIAQKLRIGVSGLRLTATRLLRYHRLFARHRHRRVSGIRTAVVEFDGAVYFVPRYGVHRPCAGLILQERYAAPGLHRLVEMVMKRRPGSMIHAGTFFGDMLPSFSRKTPGLVYAFEPVVENYLLARAVMIENGLDNVVLINAGLGAGPGVARIKTRGRSGLHRGGSSQVISDSVRRAGVQPITLHSIDQFALADLSLIQLDVEGYELPVLEGAVNSIQRHQPVIVVEDDRRNCSDLLHQLGYSQVASIGRDHVYMTDSDAARFSDLTAQVHRRRQTRQRGSSMAAVVESDRGSTLLQ